MRRYSKKQPKQSIHANHDLLAIALGHHQAGRFADAEAGYQQLIKERPDDADAWHLFGVVAAQQERYQMAVERIQRALELKPHEAVFLGNLGNAFLQQEQLGRAISCYREVLQLEPGEEEIRKKLAIACERQLDLGIEHQRSGHLEEAEACYQDVLRGQPNRADAWHLLGIIASELRQYDTAIERIEKAIEIAPDVANFYNSLGSVNQKKRRFTEAEAAYRKALKVRPDYLETHYNLGSLLQGQKRISEALTSFEKVLALDSNYHYVLGDVANCRALMCEWADQNQMKQNLLQGVHQGKGCVKSLVFLNFCDEPLEQRRCAEIWAQDHYSNQTKFGAQTTNYSHDKIRIAYISPDFRSHALTYLMADLIEQHDRSRFEVFGISIGPDEPDPWRERLMKSFDHFLNLRGESDEAVVKRLKKLEIDIAVDLAGYTGHSRTGIFALRPAPIQVNYLGFPGSMGADFIDYILADRFVIPEAYQSCYTEKVVYLPDTYQSSPPPAMAEQTPSRRELRLPETGFVFCCFNNTYKIHPPLFDIWMRLLTHTEGSVLWLFKANEAVENNLRQEAVARCVNPDRLIFNPHLQLPRYLACYRQADLFLDTWPYNAGTTASDALWAGLPVLTCSGRSFASRMGGSLLQAIGLPELITDNLADYEAVALRLAARPDELAALKQKLEQNRRIESLFNVDRFRWHIEAAYERMWQIWQQGESPISFAVAPIEKSEKLEGMSAGPEGCSSVLPASVSEQFLVHTQTDPEIPKQVLHMGFGHANPENLPQLFSTSSEKTMGIQSQKQPKQNTHDLLAIALDHHQSGRFTDAEALYQRLLEERPDDADAWHLLGVTAAQQEQFQTAVECIQRALDLNPHNPVFLGNLGNAFLQQGQLGQAISCYQKVLQLEPGEAEIRKKLATACERQLDAGIEHQKADRFAEAELCYRDVLRGQPDRADAWHLLGVIAFENGQYDTAIDLIKRAIGLAPNVAVFYNNLGGIQRKLRQSMNAQSSVRKALELQPDYIEAHCNLGNLLHEAGCFGEAEAAFRKALELRPDYSEAHYNLGNLLKREERQSEAEAAYRKALEIKPDYLEAHFALGQVLSNTSRQNEALSYFEQLLAMDPDYPYLLGKIAACRTKMCQWENHNQTKQNLLQGVQQGKRCVTPFVFLNFGDDPLEQRRCAEIWTQDHYSDQTKHGYQIPNYSHDKIRLAYISPDFRSHAVSYLMAELIEQLDRSRFEIFGISIGPNTRDPWRDRLMKSFDHFLDVRSEPDDAVVQRLRTLEIDIVVDLAGYTTHNRTGIFALRLAPIQVNYLGFPGGMGADFMDYILADRFVIPEAYQPCYTEKVVYLPDTFQSSPPRNMAEQTPSRRELGLPETGFVFCCFNNTYKIHPPLFDIWMRLLTTVEGSILWLFKANESVENNLRQEAEARGINPDRLVFAPPLPQPQYLARYRQADLFLDTLPYNAGTTASDALWAGLPVLTCSGRSFASRMGGSLLQAIGLPELITDNLAAYEAVALRLATQPDDLAALRQRLELNRRTQPLFNVDRFRRHIEAAYQRMWEISQRSEAPVSFAVDLIEESGKPAGVDAGPNGYSSVPQAPGAEQLLAHSQTAPKNPKQFLHVGCGSANPVKLPPLFRTSDWHEVRLDINPDCQPDIVASMTSMPAAATAGYAAVFSSHNLEHLYPHEVSLALKEFHRVLTPDGFALMTVPDLQSVARLIAEDQLEDPAYVSPAGPIAPLDMLYGHRPSLARGNLFMAHRTGFTAKTLANALLHAGFAQVTVKRDGRYGLWAIAYQQTQTDERMATLQKAFFPS